MDNKVSESVVEYLILVEFHHTKGPQVEYSFPPLPNNELPVAWRNLPFLCLPDGCHNVMEDLIFFDLPAISGDPNDNESIFGVTCYRQIASSELANKSSAITRSYVQKSLCVLSKKPIYGLLGANLYAVSGAFFQQKDFSEISVLKECYNHISMTVRSNVINESTMFTDISLRALVRKYRYKTLVLFKLLLLEKKVVCTGKPVRLLCDSIISLLSLMPELMATELRGAASVNGFTDFEAAFPASAERDQRGKLLRDLGLPLLPFQRGCVFRPYMCLQDLDVLTSEDCTSFLVGATNLLFLSKLPIDAVVDFEQSSLEIRDPSIKAALEMSTEDLRFMDLIVTAVDNSWQPGEEVTTWVGSDMWIRKQFEGYMLSFLSSYLRFVLDQDSTAAASLDAFNADFLDQWTMTSNYRAFKLVVNEEARFDVQAGHPCQGEYSMRDLKIRLSSTRNEPPPPALPTPVESNGPLSTSPNQPAESGSKWNMIKAGLSKWHKFLDEEKLKRETRVEEKEKQDKELEQQQLQKELEEQNNNDIRLAELKIGREGEVEAGVDGKSLLTEGLDELDEEEYFDISRVANCKDDVNMHHLERECDNVGTDVVVDGDINRDIDGKDVDSKEQSR